MNVSREFSNESFMRYMESRSSLMILGEIRRAFSGTAYFTGCGLSTKGVWGFYLCSTGAPSQANGHRRLEPPGQGSLGLPEWALSVGGNMFRKDGIPLLSGGRTQEQQAWWVQGILFSSRVRLGGVEAE